MKRSFLYLLTGVFICCQGRATGHEKDTAIILKWLDSTRLLQPTGVSWGVAFRKGTVKKTQTFTLTSFNGKQIPVQSRPMAYWPDGSLKWCGFAATVASADDKLSLNPASARSSPLTALMAMEDNHSIKVNTGKLQCIIPKSGSFLLDSLMVEGRVVGHHGRIECIIQNSAIVKRMNHRPKKDILVRLVQ